MPISWKPAFTVPLVLVGVAVTAAQLPSSGGRAGGWVRGWVLGRAIAGEVDPETKKHFDLANKLYQEQRYDDALVEYDTAYELSKNWKILYNRAQCLVLLKREPEAIQSFERYLAEGGSEIPSARREAVKADIADLKGRLGKLNVENAPAGAKIRLDKTVVGTAPMAPFDVGSGTHDLEVIPSSGGASFKTNIKVTAGNTTLVRVDLAAPPADPPVVSGPPPGMGSGSTGPDLPPPAPAPVLPNLPPGGLTAPAFQLSASVGMVFGNDHPFLTQTPMGGLEAAVAYRSSPFWEFGLFIGGATGNVRLDGAVVGTKTDVTLGAGQYDASATQRHLFGGVRARMHLVRTKRFDGWLGLDFGGWSERWAFTGVDSFTFKASSATFGLGVGVDVPLSKQWALGLSARWLGASATNGRREDCGSSNACVAFGLPGDGAKTRDARSFAEVGVRVVFSLPTGAPDPGPAPSTAPTAAALAVPKGP